MKNNPVVELSNGLADAAERAGSATVLVDGRRRMPATGIVFAAGLVITADHVVERDEDVKIGMPDGSEQQAQIAGRDPGSDLAVLKLAQATAAIAEAGTPPRVGQIVLALGRPSMAGLQASLGSISAIAGPIRTGRGAMLERYFRADTIPYPGFSGGPLVAADGSVLGMNTSGLAHGAALTIPVAIAWKIGQVLAEHGHLRRGYLGIRSQTVELAAAAQQALQRVQTRGLLIIGLENDSPAATAGLMVGDILVAVAGTPVLHHDELFGLLTGELVGKATPIQVVRGGKPQSVDVTIGER